MKKSMIRFTALAMFVGAALSPTAAIAQGGGGWGYFYFNDGNGTCGWISCGAYGCGVIDTFPCPREVSGG
jgi:hypothetical protein